MQLAFLMCDHLQVKADSMRFLAMRYNLVFSTNEDVVRLWKKHGFEIIGTLPKFFRHSRLELVDAHEMHKLLT